MTRNLFSLAAAGLLSAALAAPAAAQLPGAGGGYGNNKGGNNKGMKEEEKPEPLVIRFQSAAKGKRLGQEALIVTGTEVLTGRPRTFAVENEAPQDKNKMPKYEPRARVKEGIDKVKPGEYLKVEPKSNRDQVPWIDKADPYIAKEHEDEPGTYVLHEAYKETVGKTEVFKVVLMKFGAYQNCYAPMVKDGKDSVPDPAVVQVAEEIMKRASDPKKKELVEATVAPSKGQMVVTSIDAYQAPKAAKFTKLVDADVDGNKGQAVELDQDGKAVTLPVPGRMAGAKWVSDNDLLADARKLKPGAAVVFKTRDVGEKSYLRHLAPAPKETAKKDKAAAKTPGGDGPMLGSKEPAKK